MLLIWRKETINQSNWSLMFDFDIALKDIKQIMDIKSEKYEIIMRWTPKWYTTQACVTCSSGSCCYVESPPFKSVCFCCCFRPEQQYFSYTMAVIWCMRWGGQSLSRHFYWLTGSLYLAHHIVWSKLHSCQPTMYPPVGWCRLVEIR